MGVKVIRFDFKCTGSHEWTPPLVFKVFKINGVGIATIKWSR